MAAHPDWDELAEAAAAAEPLLGTPKSPHLKAGEELPPPDRIEVERLKGSLDRLSYRAWLWLQHHDKTGFAPLARFILGGGPEGIWVNKPLKIVTVVSEIEQFYATKHGGVTYEMVDMARRSAHAYHDDTLSIDDLVKRRRAEEAKDAERVAHAVGRGIEEAAHTPGSEIVPARSKAGEYKISDFERGALVVTKCMWEGGDKRCEKRAEGGSTLCVAHGGKAYLDQNEIQRVVRAGQERILDASDKAIDTVLELMETSVQDGIRLKAAEMILDRAGFLPGVRVEVEDARDKTTSGLTPAEIIAEKMKILASHNEPVDAEIVEDGPDVPQMPAEPESKAS